MGVGTTVTLTVDFKSVAAISSAVIALCSLVFTIVESRRSRKQLRLSVAPKLMPSFTQIDDELVIKIINVGLGPANLSEATIELDKQKYNLFLLTEVAAYSNALANSSGSRFVSKAIETIPAGDSSLLLKIPLSQIQSQKGDGISAYTQQALARTGTTLIYHSMYNEEFVYQVSRTAPEVADKI